MIKHHMINMKYLRNRNFFYEILYSSKLEINSFHSNINHFANNGNIPKLTKEVSQTCEGLITKLP